MVAMAQRNLIRNLSSLQDVGDVPYDLIKPALRKIVDPQQLRNIEIASPHIADADAELWQAMIKRDIPNWKEKMVEPKNPRSWWKVYRKLYREEKAAEEAQEAQLREVLEGKKKEKEESQATMLNTFVQQRFKQKAMVDGAINPKAGSYGFERVGSVANAKKNGNKNIISALRKASIKPPHFKTPANKPQGAEVQQRMWQTPVDTPPAKRKEKPNLLYRGPPKTVQAMTQSAFDRAMRKEEKIKEERAKQASNSPPPMVASYPAGPAQSTQPAVNRPAQNTARPSSVQSALSPPRTASPAVSNKTAAPLGPGAGSKRPLSPEKPSPALPQKRARPQTSIFMPKRVKR